MRFLPRRSSLRASVTSVGTALLLATTPALANEPKPAAKPAGKSASAPAKPKAPSAQGAVNAKPLNPIAQQVGKMGVNTCLPRIDQVTRYFSNSATLGAFAFPPHPDADKHVFSLSMEVINPNAVGYVSSSFSPTADGCDAVYDAVTYWSVSCKETAAKAFPNIKAVGVVKQDLLVLDGGPKMRVFLMPAGHGCVAIKKEILN